MRSATTALLLIAGVATAHGLPPQTLAVAPSPWADGGLVASTTFGLLVTNDRCTWQWLCADHLGVGEREVPAWFTTPSGTLFAAAFSGLFVSRDRGCSFSRVPLFDGTGASTLVVSGDTLFVTTSKFGVTNGLARSSDDGRTFEWTTLTATQAFFSAVQVAPSRPERVYVSSWYFDPKLARLWVSDDRARSFTAIDLPPTIAKGNAFFVHAVDAADPQLLFASSTDDGVVPERTSLLRSEDGGRTFTVVLTADGRVNGMTQRQGRWWVAVGDRAFASSDGRAFEVLTAPVQRACVGGAGDETLVCAREAGPDAFSLGVLDGGAVTALLKWERISGPVSCPAGSPAATACAVTWPVERAELGLELDHVATCDGMEPAPETPAPRGCGCQQTPLAVAVVVVFFRNRRGRVESGRHR